MAFLYIFSVLLITFITLVLSYFKWNYAHWKRKNVPYIEPTFPFGNTGDVFNKKKSLGFVVKQHYEDFKSKGHKYGGFFNLLEPVYIPIDLELIKDITIKSFDSFMDRGVYYNEKDDPLSAHLFSLDGQKWRRLRKCVSPTFTSGKLKVMFETLLDCTKPLKQALDQMASNKTPIDLKETMARFSIDVIGSCAFGLDCNSFERPESEFRKYGRKMFERNTFELLKVMFLITNPDWSRRLRLCINQKGVRDFFMKVIKDTVTFRENSNSYRKDMVDLLIKLKNQKNEPNEERFTENELAAQAFVFFIGAFETTSSGSTFLFYELARNQDIQQRVRDEIESVLEKHNGKITYDCLGDLTYTNQCMEEALRLHPPVTQLLRRCTEDYTIPGTNTVLEKGTRVFIPILGLHRDPEYFPDPEKFDPDRFSEENRKNICLSSYSPFGEGPRMCIGNRFAVMNIKATIITFLKNFKVSINKNTPVPFKVDPLGIVYFPEHPILLDIERIVN